MNETILKSIPYLVCILFSCVVIGKTIALTRKLRRKRRHLYRVLSRRSTRPKEQNPLRFTGKDTENEDQFVYPEFLINEMLNCIMEDYIIQSSRPIRRKLSEPRRVVGKVIFKKDSFESSNKEQA